MFRQSTSKVIMIRPVSFNYNSETAKTNSFQQESNISSSLTQTKALQEFDAMTKLLEKNKVEVKVFEDTLDSYTPDSVFPNNWFSTHQNGSIFLYSMYNLNRRLEKRGDIITFLISQGFNLKPENDFSKYETKNLFLEGTGSLVLDRINKIAYACLSARTNQVLFDEFCQKAGFQGISFQAFDQLKNPIYHTNVMMGIGTSWAYVCLDAIVDLQEREKVRKSLSSTGHKIIELNQYQIQNFAGNVLELENLSGKKFILISKTAFDSLFLEQKKVTEEFVDWIVPDIKTIETNGGGSSRCMVAEIFTP